MVAHTEQRYSPISTGAMLGLIVIAWGGNYALVKLALLDIAPFTFNVLRFAGAAAVIGSLALLSGRRVIPVTGERAMLAWVGFFQVTVMLGFTSLGLLWIEASRAVLIAYTMPLWALILGWIVLGEPITPGKLLGGCLGFFGLVMLFNPLAMDWSRGDLLLGSAIALCGSIGWAAGSTVYRTRAWETPYWPQVFWQALIGVLPLAALALAFERNAPIDPTPRLAGLVVYNWVIPGALAYWCWANVLTRMAATTAGQFLMLAPVYGVALASLIFAEPLDPMLVTSGALILTGAWLTLRAGASASPRANQRTNPQQ